MSRAHKFKIPIAVKLIAITVTLLLAASVPIAFQSASEFENMAADREKAANLDQARARAAEVESLFFNYIDKIKVIAGLLLKESSLENRNQALELTFRKDRDLVSIEVMSADNRPPVRVVNEEYLNQYKLEKSYIERLRKRQVLSGSFQSKAIFAGEIEIRNSSQADGAPLITMGIPLAKDDYGRITHIAIADIRLDRLQKAFGNVSERVMYLVDKEGRLLAHPDEKLVFEGRSMADVPVVRKSLISEIKQQQVKYVDHDGKSFFGAFTRTPLGLAVIAQASEDVILENAKRVRRESFYIAGRVLSIALFLIFLFSITLTAPIEKLVRVASQIAHGNFEVKSNITSRDEVGELANAFDNMVEGLKERDKVKNVLNKFHGSSIAEDLLKGDLALGGSRKHVTVFFSDIRDFTKFSEGHTPEEVVEMLNEYFHIMVGIINKHKGVVDKFIGDAIMAVWGAPENTAEDASNAVRACLEMRQALQELNNSRQERGKVPIRIGMGLHTGKAISGTIGSDERMEYTVIGDTVNQSSRIEASTKAFGTDLLLSESTMKEVENNFLIEKAGDVEVKGKSEPLSLYKVKGFIDEQGQAVEVRTDYSDYEAEKVDKVRVA